MFEIIDQSDDLLGECPIWCPRTHRLFRTNILGNELLAYEPATGARERWAMPERLASFAFTARQGVLLLGLESCLAFFDLATGTFMEIGASPGNLGTRIGDGRCDRAGNFVFGTMHEGVPQERVGAFYRLNAQTMTIESLALPGVAIANGICFSPDGATMYYCDSLQPKILCCDYPSLENQRVFADVIDGGGPDGSCVDADGFVWNAQWGGSRVVRYQPDGGVDRVIAAPASQTTCPAIGGPSGEMLYCTSARVGIATPTDADGALLGVSVPGINGLPETCFAA
ncbi:SMP-30/gluconolactonase/LRE family protein [Janthinobacterium aquaticum]|uniref:SMP-30/gluconolactonase/LRE family protein n=1 Tax=Janthinobacterium sp. FT58W TaxID=2654254 RepID=UPI0012648911|nr:SMP-30/gluconolactonase/LRE family protein [Janthinobacterium sp. FT58W]KAB8042035.1 SMP-30/gluconolactonase/LRE family protein [Janthinobacterium sp. FT58W]